MIIAAITASDTSAAEECEYERTLAVEVTRPGYLVSTATFGDHDDLASCLLRDIDHARGQIEAANRLHKSIRDTRACGGHTVCHHTSYQRLLRLIGPAIIG